jgi:glycosidase
MSAVNGDKDKAKMAAALLLTLPGSPYLYYGEEIGMLGKKPDEQIREPFLWEVKAKDQCRTSWVKPQFSTDATIMPLSQQMKDKNSVYNHYKTFVGLRNQSPVLTYGELAPANLAAPGLTAFTRTYQNQSLLVMHNLSQTDINLTLPQDLQSYQKIYFKNKSGKLNKNTVVVPAYSTLVLQK